MGRFRAPRGPQKKGRGEQRKTKLQLMRLLPISYLEKTLGPDFRWHDLLSNITFQAILLVDKG